MSTKRIDLSADILLRFDGAAEAEPARLVSSAGTLAVVFEQPERDMDLSELCYGIVGLRRYWYDELEGDIFRQMLPDSAVDWATSWLPAWLTAAMVDGLYNNEYAATEGRWHLYRIVLTDGRAFELVMISIERKLIWQLEKLRSQRAWRRRFKR